MRGLLEGAGRILPAALGPLPQSYQIPVGKYLPNSSHSSLLANKDVVLLASFFPTTQDALERNIL